MLRKPGGDREMVHILSLVLHHNKQNVLCAAEIALEVGGRKANRAADVTPPTAPSLSKESEANVARYDGFRQGATRHAS